MNFVKQCVSNQLNWKLVVLLIFACIVACIVCIACIICVAIVCYVFLFYCKKTMDDYNIFFNVYNSASKKVIEKYGDCRITRVYLITHPLTKFSLFMLNLVTMRNSKPAMVGTMHLQLMIEIKVNKHEKKMILIDKTNCINLMTDFHIDDTCVIVPIKIKQNQKHKPTLRGVLDKTCDRIGELKFFNWHIYKNNCHHFIKNVIIQINDEFRCSFIQSSKKFKHVCNKLFCNEMNMCLYHVCMFFYNFFQKYIVNVKQHILSICEYFNG